MVDQVIEEHVKLISIVVEIGVNRFGLNLFGTHGVYHWHRVMRNGIEIYMRSGEILDETSVFAIAAFAMLHDCEREDEYTDPDHGNRASEQFLLRNEPHINSLGDDWNDKIFWAIRDHNTGKTSTDFYTQAMWASDRLDLRRVGIEPDPSLLVIPAAIQMNKEQA